MSFLGEPVTPSGNATLCFVAPTPHPLVAESTHSFGEEVHLNTALIADCHPA